MANKGFQIGAEVDVRQTIRSLKEWREAVKADLSNAYDKIAPKIISEAKSEAPSRTGALKESIRRSATKKAASVRAGGRAKVPYGPVQWGIVPGPGSTRKVKKWRRIIDPPRPYLFLYKAIYPTGRKGDGVAPWIESIIIEEVNKATARLNRRMTRAVKG